MRITHEIIILILTVWFYPVCHLLTRVVNKFHLNFIY